MYVTRRQFIAATAALATAPLLACLVLNPVDPNNLNPARWYQVWLFTPSMGQPIPLGRFKGMRRWPVRSDTYLTEI